MCRPWQDQHSRDLSNKRRRNCLRSDSFRERTNLPRLSERGRSAVLDLSVRIADRRHQFSLTPQRIRGRETQGKKLERKMSNLCVRPSPDGRQMLRRFDRKKQARQRQGVRTVSKKKQTRRERVQAKNVLRIDLITRETVSETTNTCHDADRHFYRLNSFSRTLKHLTSH